jgi:hypothetical protein
MEWRVCVCVCVCFQCNKREKLLCRLRELKIHIVYVHIYIFRTQTRSPRGYGFERSLDADSLPCFSSAQNSSPCHSRLFSLSKSKHEQFYVTSQLLWLILRVRERYDVAQSLFIPSRNVRRNKHIYAHQFDMLITF